MDSEIKVGQAAAPSPMEWGRKPKAEQARLKEACRDFEGVLLGLVLKDGLKTDLTDDEESSGGDMYRDFAAEQTARDLGQNESFGIAKMMYEQLSGEKRHAH